ncbi:hypothetical protein NC653_009996 [Populus alba x Populus x berolinensis]|uniref:Uncharacterized protein n=1 Tax=Populus alba x Populus x berolinensis TaxID=444605 RepID=A0AAD6RAK6_9ROSI|nr:hypothetical protein NC653_009879 [Populus alba x Populus x berolinensis]KAJ7005361.1 hypothetical protein NC653_009996 [Populus alba x Populus x berolinensis]
MMELAMALEACGKHFIWVVRPPVGFDINMEFKAKEWLPEGFEERMEHSKRGWPLAAEQFYNVKLLEEHIGVCLEVARGKSCEVRQEDIVKKIMLVMDETEKGNAMRRKAREVRDMILDAVQYENDHKGSSVKAMDEFLDAASLMREGNKWAADRGV